MMDGLCVCCYYCRYCYVLPYQWTHCIRLIYFIRRRQSVRVAFKCLTILLYHFLLANLAYCLRCCFHSVLPFLRHTRLVSSGAMPIQTNDNCRAKISQPSQKQSYQCTYNFENVGRTSCKIPFIFSLRVCTAREWHQMSGWHAWWWWHVAWAKTHITSFIYAYE